MSKEFYNDVSQWVKQTERDAKAWLGALQFVVYSRPARTGTLKTDSEHDAVAEESGRKHIKNKISLSSDNWYEGVRGRLEGEIKNAEGALSNEWSMRRDPRHDSSDDRDRFAHKFEDNAARIAAVILEAEDQIAAGVIPPNRQITQTLGILKDDLRKIVDLYSDHCYEMTFNESGGGLLALRARIVDGKSKAL